MKRSDATAIVLGLALGVPIGLMFDNIGMGNSRLDAVRYLLTTQQPCSKFSSPESSTSNAYS